MANEFKIKFNELSRALQDLHRDLLRLEAKKLEAATGRPLTPYELLNASLNDQNLAWLRDLTSLIVHIDTNVDESPNLTAHEANLLADRGLALLDKPADAPATTFWTNYTAALAAHPDLILKHARVKDLLSSLKPKM